MQRPEKLAYTVLASLAILTAGVSQAQANTITVTRGPNGAAYQVDMDNIPVGAQVQPTGSLSPAQRVVVQGPNGAFRIDDDQSPASVDSSASKALSPSKLKIRGPHGAEHLGN